jgi:hypothetical protein
MNYGFRIAIHKDVPGDLMEEARKRCDSFLKLASHREKRYGETWVRPGSYASGYLPSFYNRGIIGFVFADKKLTFRRISKNRRIFAVVPIDMVKNKDGSELDLHYCVCPCCVNGMKKVTMKPYDEKDYNTFIEVGDIKG